MLPFIQHRYKARVWFHDQHLDMVKILKPHLTLKDKIKDKMPNPVSVNFGFCGNVYFLHLKYPEPLPFCVLCQACVYRETTTVGTTLWCKSVTNKLVFSWSLESKDLSLLIQNVIYLSLGIQQNEMIRSLVLST